MLYTNSSNVLPREPEFDVAFSYSDHDRDYVFQVASYLAEKHIKVYYDKFFEADLWGKDRVEVDARIFGSQFVTRFVIIFASEHFIESALNKHQLRHALASALKQQDDHVLVARFDDTLIPGIVPTKIDLDLKYLSPSELGERIIRKIKNVVQIPIENLPRLLCSAGTTIAFEINEKYYSGKHFMWAVSSNPSLSSGDGRPPSSNPLDIYNSLWRDVRASDRHSNLILAAKSGIIRGAKLKFESGIISRKIFDEIKTLTWEADRNKFTPLLYFIPTSDITNKIYEVPYFQRKQVWYREYIIRDINREFFDVIDLKK